MFMITTETLSKPCAIGTVLHLSTDLTHKKPTYHHKVSLSIMSPGSAADTATVWSGQMEPQRANKPVDVRIEEVKTLKLNCINVLTSLCGGCSNTKTNVIFPRWTQLRRPPRRCPLSPRPCSMSLMSSRSSLMTLMRWLKPSCCCFKCWKQRCAEQGTLCSVRRIAVMQSYNQSKDASLVWFLGAGLRPRCSAPPISRRQSDSASESGTSIRSGGPGGTDDMHFETIHWHTPMIADNFLLLFQTASWLLFFKWKNNRTLCQTFKP